MSDLESNLIRLYLPLVTWVGLGVVLGMKLPVQVPFYLGKFLFWVGVPISILAFLRQADLSESVWVVPAIAWVAILLGASLAWAWIMITGRMSRSSHFSRQRSPSREGIGAGGDASNIANEPFSHPPHPAHQRWSLPTQGSFMLSAMIGNTGYLGYPVTLTLIGPKFFGWAIFYDLLGSTLGAYGLGVILAARFGTRYQNMRQLFQAILINPAFWSFWAGLGFRQVPLPQLVERVLLGIAWAIVASSLLLLGMRLSQVSSWRNAQKAAISLSIKMLIVPMALGLCLPLVGITGSAQLVVVLQMAMPPAFATLVIAEAYNLDRGLTVTTLAIGSIGILATLPIWLWLFRP
ncbi:MAG TPA: AEC family transporter [Elainellaceae cyanobacterium]